MNLKQRINKTYSRFGGDLLNETALGGKKILANDLIDIFEASEGEIDMIYGKIGNGKTYCATYMIIDLLEQGKVVYCNWHIIVKDFDDRESFWHLIKNILIWRKTFYKIPLEKNLHFFNPENFNGTGELVEWLSGLNDCHIFYDEGQDMFDSYEGTKFSKAKRRLVLHTRHYHRTLYIISQRPTAIQVSARGNVNRFYKCVKISNGFAMIPPRFARYEFQEMTGETVNEEAEPESTRVYWGKSKIFNAYNTNYLAEGIPKSQAVFFEAYELGFWSRIKHLYWRFKGYRMPRSIKIQRPMRAYDAYEGLYRGRLNRNYPLLEAPK